MIVDMSTQAQPVLLNLEDRCAPRARIAIPATLRIAGGGRSFPTMLQDISVAGFCATSINRLTVNSLCWLSIPGLESQQAQVVWWNAGLLGGAFAKLLNPIVLEHLIDRWRECDRAGRVF